MKIRIEQAVLDYAKKNKYESIVIENTPVGCSCVGIHLHPQPEYCDSQKRLSLQKDETFFRQSSEEDFEVWMETVFFDLEEVYIFGKLNPFNKRMYLHADIKK